jgi:muramoyltetrapeptide carboxypeptidase
MLTPNYLQPGDQIGIVAPARWIPQDKYPEIIQLIESKGYEPVRGKSTYLEHGIFAGTDEQRLTDMQQMIDDPKIKAVFCLRGGYGSIRIINRLKFDRMKAYPKWLIGFSDITIFHSALSSVGIESLHGQMPVNFDNKIPNIELDKLNQILTTNKITHSFTCQPDDRFGHSVGEMTGGNLSILCSLIGTPLQINTQGKILFIEEVGEYLYRIDRMMHQLKQAGLLSDLAGLIVGYFTRIDDNSPAFGQTYREIIMEAVKDTEYPVAFGFPAGHNHPNYPLIMGRKARLSVEKCDCTLSFD